MFTIFQKNDQQNGDVQRHYLLMLEQQDFLRAELRSWCSIFNEEAISHSMCKLQVRGPTFSLIFKTEILTGKYG